MRVRGLRGAVARILFVAQALLAFHASAGASVLTASTGRDATDAISLARAAEQFGKLPLHFEPNTGQADPSARFVARGPGYRLLLTSGAALVSLTGTAAADAGDAQRNPGTTIGLHFEGTTATAVIAGEAALAGKSHYFLYGNADYPVTEVPHFARVRISELYPGIDVVYYGNPRELEYDFVVAPGSDPRIIRMRFEGAEEIRIDPRGDLLLRTGAGELRQYRPRIYQDVNGVRTAVGGGYAALGAQQIGFHVDRYDASKPLIIDPVFSYSTFLGGKNTDAGTAIAVDAAGNVYVAGSTYSNNFPLVNPYDSHLGNSDQDVYVAKLNAAGTALLYSTYVGGSRGLDSATGIAIDAQGNAYVTGSTNNTDFPTSVTAYQTAPASGGGAFAFKLGPTGNTLVYSTYLLNASSTRIAVDGVGGAYLTGQASAGFATSAGAFQATMRAASGKAPFALKLNPAGTGIAYATFVGGSGVDTAKAMALDAAGNLYLGGSTSSPDFPLMNPLQASLGGGADGFVAKLNPTGTALLYSTYLGGVLDDAVNAIAVDQTGSAYLGGETYSSNFPIKNAFQAVKAGHFLVNSSLGNGFVAKLLPAGNALAWSSFLGGEVCTVYCQLTIFGVPAPRPQYAGDAVYGIAVDGQGHALVTGVANSYSFPLVDSRLPRKQEDNQNSLFVTKVARDGAALLYSSLLYTGFGSRTETEAGVPADIAHAIAADSAGNAYVTLQQPADFPTTPGAYQTLSNVSDAVVFKLSSGSATLALGTSPNPSTGGNNVTISASVAGAAPSGVVTFLDRTAVIGAVPVLGGNATFSLALPVGIRSLSAIYRDGVSEVDAGVVYQVVNPLDVCP